MTTRTAGATGAIDLVEFMALHDLWTAASPATRAALGLICERREHLLVVGVAATPRVPMLNRVMGVGQGDWDADLFREAQALLHGRGCVCQVSLRDGAPAAGRIRADLARLGYAEDYAWMKFVHRDAPPPGADRPAPLVRVARCSRAGRGSAGHVLAAGFGLPAAFAGVWEEVVGRDRWHCYVARTPDGAPAGVGALFVDGDAAWLGLGATLPEARGRGAQSELLRVRVEEARRMGCALIVTETGERVDGRPSGSYRNILRAGFAEHGLRPNLTSPPPGP